MMPCSNTAAERRHSDSEDPHAATRIHVWIVQASDALWSGSDWEGRNPITLEDVLEGAVDEIGAPEDIKQIMRTALECLTDEGELVPLAAGKLVRQVRALISPALTRIVAEAAEEMAEALDIDDEIACTQADNERE